MQRFVARDIVFRFPNIQTKQKIYKKKNNRQTNTKEGRALLFVCLLFFLRNKAKTDKQTERQGVVAGEVDLKALLLVWAPAILLSNDGAFHQLTFLHIVYYCPVPYF